MLQDPPPPKLIPSPVEHRIVPRYTFVAVADLTETATKTCSTGRVAEISRGGCFIDVQFTFPVGTLLSVCISGERGTFATRGEILYMQERIGMGLRFVDTPQDQLKILDTWLAELSANGAI